MDINTLRAALSTGSVPAGNINTNAPNTQRLTEAALKLLQASAGSGNTEIPAQLLSLDKMSEALITAGLKPTDANIKMLEAMLTSGFPADAKNLQKMNQAFKLTGEIDKALFFMQTDIRMNHANANAVNNYANGNIRILNQLTDMFKALDALPQGEVKELLTAVFEQNASVQTFMDAVEVLPDTSLTGAVPPEKQDVADTAKNLPQLLESALKDGGKEQLVPAAKLLVDSAAETLGKQPQDVSPKELLEFVEKAPIEAEVKTELLKVLKPLSDNAEIRSKTTAPVFGKEIFEHGNTEKPRTERTDLNTARLVKRFALDPNASKREDLDRILSDLKQAAEQARIVVEKQGPQEKNAAERAFLNTLRNVSENIDFMSQIRNSVYVQIPVLINNRETNTEVFVFPNKKGGKRKSESALIALDLHTLGHFEAYLHKSDNQLNCQFRVNDEYVLQLIKEQLPKLDTLLAEKRIHLQSVAYKKIGEPFTIVDKEPVLGDEKETEFFFDMKA